MRAALPSLCLAIVLLAVSSAPDAPARPPHLEPARLEWQHAEPPWRQRANRDEDAPAPNGRGLLDIRRWPAEPEGPAEVTKEALEAALKDLCGAWMPKQRPGKYAAWILEHSAHFDVDPLVVAGLIISRSQCRPQHEKEGFGLSQVHDKMHWGSLRDRTYRYQVWTEAGWDARELDLSQFQFTRYMLRQAEANIYFTAGLLKVATEQCPHNDGAFGSVAHRHPVSHVLWGDRVKGTDGEDQALRVRRMLLEHMTGVRPPLTAEFHGLTLVSPLDGAPRKITSAMGDERDNGRRKHEGVDFASYIGEPVRAVADGTVVFAGIGGMNVAPSAIRSVKSKPMGKAGIYIKLQHAGDVLSAYMHLNDVVVKKGQEVKAGQLIGHVGRTGIQQSSAHLHFELRVGGERVDPMPGLEGMVFGPETTWRGQRIEYSRAKKAKKKKKKARRPPATAKGG